MKVHEPPNSATLSAMRSPKVLGTAALLRRARDVGAGVKGVENGPLGCVQGFVAPAKPFLREPRGRFFRYGFCHEGELLEVRRAVLQRPKNKSPR